MTDANQLLTEIGNKLDELANQAVNIISDDRSFMEIWGWNCPAINRHDFARIIRKPRMLIDAMENKEVSDEDIARLQAIPAQLAYFQGNTLPNLPGGNAFHVYLTTLSMIDNLTDILSEYVKADPNWEEIKDKKLLPSAVIKRLRDAETTITGIVNSTDNLNAQIRAINAAHNAAESLPADQENLRQARQQVADILKAAQTDSAAAALSKNDAADILVEIKGIEEESKQVLQAAGVAYQASTTKGLGEEFGLRAGELSRQVKWLGGGLVVVLVAIACLSYYRANQVHDLLMDESFQMYKIWPEIGVSIGSLVAPIWLAWMITKQIGQRFRLAEDYAFKASVAKAFAGYKAEAAQLDKDFEKRLFRSALDRVEEPPLRYVEDANHGSPLQDFIAFVLNLKGIRKNLGELKPNDTAVAVE